MALSENPVIVCGMYRSGTSITANILAHLGVFMGSESAFYPTDSYNESGYFEHREITRLSRRILASLSMTYHRLWPVPEDWREWPRSEALLREIDRVFSKEFSGKERWGWKDPMAGPVLPFYLEFLRRQEIKPHVVICVRNPMEIEPSMAGLFSQEPISGYLAYSLWLHYTLSALYESSGQIRTVVMYDELLEKPRLALSSVAALFGSPPDEKAWARAASEVRPELCHRHSGPSALKELPPIFSQTLELCRRCAADPAGLRSGSFDPEIADLWRQLNDLKEMGGERSLPFNKLSAHWHLGEGKDAKTEARYLPSRRWQIIGLPINAPRLAEVSVSIFQLPGVVWIRQCALVRDSSSTPLKPYEGDNGVMENEAGFHRLLVFGMHSDQFRIRMPEEGGEGTIQFEVLIQTDYFIAIEILRKMRDSAAASARRVNDLEEHCLRLEQRSRS